MTKDAMGSVSGLCLTARPEHLAEVEASLRDLDWVEVHGRDEVAGRLVVVQEHRTVEEHQQGLRRLQAVPYVLTADLVVHHMLPSSEEGLENRRSK